MLPFFFCFWKVWRFALADRGLDMTSHFARHRLRDPYAFGNKNPEDHGKSSGSKTYCRSYSVASYIFSC